MYKYIVLLLFLFETITFNISLADNSLSVASSRPSFGPPPPDDGSCGKGGHGKDTRRACDSFQWKLNKYLREEGDKKRGLRFYEAILDYESENRDKNNNYQIKISNILKYFGKPDYKRNSNLDGKRVKEYAYVFNYHSNKDWVCIISFNKNDVKSVSYGETIGITFGGWVEYE